jgi:sugar lactone lactonase YvrE
MMKPTLSLFLVFVAGAPASATSYYTTRPEDARAVYLTPENFAVRGDGDADDTLALQSAIDRVQETTTQGIVFIPPGRYRLTATVFVWPGIRLIGYGEARPVFALGPRTPGYQDPEHEKYLVFFAGARRASLPPPDANPGTFYSAVSNIDIEIGDGNPGAVGVRGRYAQHSFLAHMEFRIGSGLAGVHETGNVVEDVLFRGGEYGIWTGRPSPGWQFTAVDATFDGQRTAAIREREAGLTLIRPTFRHVPTAIAIEPGHTDELWIRDGRLEDISGPAVVIGNEASALTQINMEQVVCRNVPAFASFQESGRTVAAPAATYAVATFTHGVALAPVGAEPGMRDVFDAAPLTALPAAARSDLPSLPGGDTWVNVRDLGARGDGTSDDTEAFRRAIAGHQTIYLPSGHYVVTDTLVLRPDTVLIGFHPGTTQIDLPDRTPAFQGVGSPKPLIEAPRGGTNILTGIGVYTGGINPRAVGVKWMAGAGSMMNDVRLLGGHGTNRMDGTRENPYNNTHTADPDLNRRWDGQYPSLWVTDGGGGTFLDIWTPSTFAQAGMVVSNTTTDGRVYQMSSEHHVRHEVQLHNVSNWRIYALQTEEERGEGGFALPVEIDHSSHITFANFFAYRVISSFQPYGRAVAVTDSTDIRFRNVHVYSNSKVSFDAAVSDATAGVETRQREFAWLDVSGGAPQAVIGQPSAVLEPGARMETLADGFYNISGGAVDPAGDFYFVDAHWQRIYRWAAAARRLTTVADSPLDPVNLAFDRAGNLLVASYAGSGTVYAFKPLPGTWSYEISVLSPQPVAPRPGLTAVLPAGDWRVNRDMLERPAAHYVSPDGTTFLPAGEDFVNGATSWGVKSSAQLRAFGLAKATTGQRAYIADEADQSTWVGTVGPDGSLRDLQVFAYQGSEGTAVDDKGNVYIAAGQIYVYAPSGRLLEIIKVPERPLQLVFGGADGHTLFVPARSSLYAIRTRYRGR